MRGAKARFSATLLAMTLALAGCSSLANLIGTTSGNPVGQAGNVKGFLGGVVADEPQAALVGRRVLSAGGNAADAVAAMGFTLAVTLPSRAGLGSGGACLAYDPRRSGPGGGAPEAVLFNAVAPAAPGSADRPAGVPMLARGLFALQARYGSRPMEELIVSAEQFARFGVPVSRALLRDLTVVAGPLSADPASQAVFFPAGRPLAEGAILVQPELGGTLAQLRLAGVGDLYQGLVAHRLEDGMKQAGGGLTVADMRAALPRFEPSLQQPAPNDDVVAFLPAPEAGGVATAAALQILARDPNALQQAAERAAAVAARFRQGGVTAQSLLSEAGSTSGASPSLGALPASTTFGAIDRDGGAVMCGVSMGNLFGTGRIAPGTGILLGASPARVPAPLLAVTMLYNPTAQAFHGMAGGSGQAAAPLAAAVGLVTAMTGKLPPEPPEPGRANVIACRAYLPPNASSCAWAVDPRSYGLAAGSN